MNLFALVLEWRIPHHCSYILRASTDVSRTAPLLEDGRRACVRHGPFMC